MADDKGTLTTEEKKLVEYINKNDEQGVFEMLDGPAIDINKLDENGMNMINHAAYRGNVNMVKQLLKLGADVNSYKHEHGYTTLMFAALSGKRDVTQLILEAGAKTDRLNSVGRTAAQMAAFVGQHQVVSLINNFLQYEEVEYFTRIQGFETEPRLPPSLIKPLYHFILNSNLSPVMLSLYLQKTPCLLEESEKVCRVLDQIAERQMKCSQTNEILSMKCHYMGQVVRQCKKSMDAKNDNLEYWIKSLLRGRDSDGFCETQEKFIRSTFADFPWADSQLLVQIIRNLSNVKMGDDPTALTILTQAINGQRMASEDDLVCHTCAEFKASKKCVNCKMVNYCDQACQKLHWFTHKKHCKLLAEEFKEIEKMKAINAKREEERIAKKEEERIAKEEEERITKEEESKTNVVENKQQQDEENKESIVDQKTAELKLDNEKQRTEHES